MSDLDDPRVFFAAERTLMAWNRTGLTLMAFGFVLERFGLFLHVLRATPQAVGRDLSFWIGVGFILLGLAAMVFSIRQYQRVLSTLKPVEIPERYHTRGGILLNLAVTLLGFALLAYLFSEL